MDRVREILEETQIYRPESVYEARYLLRRVWYRVSEYDSTHTRNCTRATHGKMREENQFTTKHTLTPHAQQILRAFGRRTVLEIIVHTPSGWWIRRSEVVCVRSTTTHPPPRQESRQTTHTITAPERKPQPVWCHMPFAAVYCRNSASSSTSVYKNPFSIMTHNHTQSGRIPPRTDESMTETKSIYTWW